jgi:hypothetical protein
MAPSAGSVVAPILGAAGGTIVVTIAVEKFGIRRPVAAFGTAAVSLIAARSAKGAARAGLEAAAIASICIGVTEVLARIRKPNQQRVAPAAQQFKPAAPPAPPRDAVTSSEFRNALATIEAKHQADVTRREEANRATIHTLLAQLRGAQEAKKPRLHVVDVSSEPPPDARAVVARMAAIYPLLDENERRRWSSMVATMPTQELTRIQRELMRRTPDEGAAFLRSTVLATALRLPS